MDKDELQLDKDELQEKLERKIKTLNKTVWENKCSKSVLDKWTQNFSADEAVSSLYLLSQFMYFANTEIRYLLRSLFRDKYKYPIVQEVREGNGDTTDVELIERMYNEELRKTRFLGMGDSSESGALLLYYFRQENRLGKHFFINKNQLFTKNKDSGEIEFSEPHVTRYVFIDDFVGSGVQAASYSKSIIKQIKNISDKVEISYLPIFGTKEGLNAVRAVFDKVESIYEVDETYKCFSENSRYKPTDEYSHIINWPEVKSMCEHYGAGLVGSVDSLGFSSCQLLLGFSHNTPDNTLPIFWYDDPKKGPSWSPIFKRYPK